MASPDIAAAHFYDRVVNLLTKEPRDRGETEIEQILSWFRKKSELFKPLKNGIYNNDTLCLYAPRMSSNWFVCPSVIPSAYV